MDVVGGVRVRTRKDAFGDDLRGAHRFPLPGLFGDVGPVGGGGVAFQVGGFGAGHAAVCRGRAVRMDQSRALRIVERHSAGGSPAVSPAT
ncbi:hypothetical protein GCM10010230_35190 [Streptomyces narbonensis]|nr:hypothetical protein GCM10010230_35190 [Streptomyces narbonensis]